MTATPANPPLEVRIDLSDCTSKAALIERFAGAFELPPWFGFNWDALADCLTDLSWLPASGYRLALLQPGQLRQADPETLATALEIIDETTAYWADQGIAFTVELVEDDAEATKDPLPRTEPR